MSQGGLPGVVFDTMILVSGDGQHDRPCRRAPPPFEAGRFILYVSHEILDEARDVLSRPELMAQEPANHRRDRPGDVRSPGPTRPDGFSVPSLFALPRDPDDEPYLNLALAADADYLGGELMGPSPYGMAKEWLAPRVHYGMAKEWLAPRVPKFINLAAMTGRRSMIRSERRSRNEISDVHT